MLEQISTETALLYASYSILGILFLTTLLFLFLFTGSAKRGEKSPTLHIKERVKSLYDELDKMLFEYLAGKPDGSDKSGSDKEYRVNLYYALLSDRENINRVHEKISNISAAVSESIKSDNKSLKLYLQKAQKAYKDIEIKAAEIIKTLNESKGLCFVKDDIMPYLYIENDQDRSLKILAMYEELSAMLCKSREMSDVRFLDMLENR